MHRKKGSGLIIGMVDIFDLLLLVLRSMMFSWIKFY